MKGLRLNRSKLVLGIALSIVGIGLVALAVLMIPFTDYPPAVAAAIGMPGLGLIAASGLVLTAPSRRQ